MGVFNKSIPTYTLNKDNNIRIVNNNNNNIPVNATYIDDVFDPLFNTQAKAYLNQKYGNPVLGTLGGYMEGIDNALVGQKDQWGILGPGMGVLSYFGRSMDKADDFILGNLTELANAANGQGWQNPMNNIFMKDEDYTGKRLLASTGNIIANMSGKPRLNEEDFSGLGWNLAGTGLDLATDPGVIGGNLTRNVPEIANMKGLKSTPDILNAISKGNNGILAPVGQLLSNYDDFMNKVAINGVLPGSTYIGPKIMGQLSQLIGNSSYKDYKDAPLDTIRSMAKNTKDKLDASGTPLTGKDLSNYYDIYTFSSPEATKVPIDELYDRVKHNDFSDLSENASKINTKEPKSELDIALKKFKDGKELTPSEKDLINNYDYDTTFDEFSSGTRHSVAEAVDFDIGNDISDANKSITPTGFDGSVKFNNHQDMYKNNIDKYKNTPIEQKLSNFKKEVSTNSMSNMKDLNEYINNNSEFRALYTSDLIKDTSGTVWEKHPKWDPNNYSSIVDDISNKKLEYASNLKNLEDEGNKLIAQQTKIYDTLTEQELKSVQARTLKGPKADELNRLDTLLSNNMLDIKTLDKNYTTTMKDFEDLKDEIFNSPQGDYFKELLSNSEIDSVDQYISNAIAKDTTKRIYGKNPIKIGASQFKNAEHTPAAKEYVDTLLKNVMDANIDDGVNIKNVDSLVNYFETITGKSMPKKYKNAFTYLFDPTSKHYNNHKYMKDATASSWLDTLQDLSEYTHRYIEKDAKLMNTPRARLWADFSNDVETNVVNVLRNKANLLDDSYANVADPAFMYDGLQKILNEHPDFFLKDNDYVRSNVTHSQFGKSFLNDTIIDSEKVARFRNANPNLQISYGGDMNYNFWDPYTHSVKNGNFDYMLYNAKNEKGELLFTKNYVPPKKLKGIISKEEYFKPKSGMLIESNPAVNDELIQFKKLDDTAFVKTLESPSTAAQDAMDGLQYEIIKDNPILNYAAEFHKNLDSYIKTNGTPQEKRLFGLINDANVSNNRFNNNKYNTLMSASAKQDLSKAQEITKKYIPEQIKKSLYKLDNEKDFVTGQDFFNDFISTGKQIIALPSNSVNTINLMKQLEHNVLILNSNGKHVAKIINADIDGYKVLGLSLVEDNSNIVNDIISNYKKGAYNTFGDIMWWNPIKNTEPLNACDTDISNLFKNVGVKAQDYYTKLGFKDTLNNELHIKHSLIEDGKGSSLLEKVYKNMDIDTIQDDAMSVMNELNLNTGALGSRYQSKSIRGSLQLYDNAGIFDTDLTNIVKSQYSKGILDDKHVQSLEGLMFNDNFKINKNFKDVNSLKRVLNMPDSGNMDNLTIISPRYNENGKLTSMKRYNKFSDDELTKALKDNDAIICPTNAIAPLDRLLKKDRKMSNKLYRFINKYITLPFKFGVLNNPGFVVGNMTDAYLKQALTNSTKNGTSLSSELIEVSRSLNDVMNLNNNFSNIHTKYLAEMELLKKPILGYNKTYDSILTSKKSRQDFLDWFNTTQNLSDKERKITKLYLFINNSQNTKAFANNFQDMEDLESVAHTTKHTVTPNIVNRIAMGKGQYSSKNLTTWGLFSNNPISNKIMELSNQTESYFRSAAILNDLRRKYPKNGTMAEILSAPMDKEALKNLTVAMNDAVNTMYNSNFNYDDVTILMDTVGYAMPFPTFYLKNMGYWLDILTDHPQVIENAIKTQTGMWTGKDTENDQFQAEAKGRGAVPIGQNSSNFIKGIFKPTPLNSLFGAFNSMNDPVSNAAYRLNPITRLATMNSDKPENIKYRPYSTNVYEKNITKADPNFNALRYQFHSLNPYERTINTYLRAPSKVRSNTAQLSDFLPSVFQPDFSKKSK